MIPVTESKPTTVLQVPKSFHTIFHAGWTSDTYLQTALNDHGLPMQPQALCCQLLEFVKECAKSGTVEVVVRTDNLQIGVHKTFTDAILFLNVRLHEVTHLSLRVVTHFEMCVLPCPTVHLILIQFLIRRYTSSILVNTRHE